MSPPNPRGTTTLDDIRLPKDDTMDLDGETIKILVGSDPPTPFYVHEGLIRASSDFFDAALKHNWKEAMEREIKLPEDDPEIFRMYLHWLYRDPLPSMLRAPVPEVEEEFTSILKAYDFGDKIQDTTFCDVVHRCYNPQDQHGRPGGPVSLPWPPRDLLCFREQPPWIPCKTAYIGVFRVSREERVAGAS